MKRLASVLAFAFTIGLSSPAWSLGGIGVKGGTGFSIYVAEDDLGDDYVAPNITPMVFGVTWTLGLLLAEVEVDLFYMRTTTSGGTPSVSKSTAGHLALPAIAKVQMPVIPALVGLQFGAGLEMRYALDPRKAAEGVPGEKSTVYYLPIVLGADLDAMVARATAELRYEHQLTDHVEGSGDRIHQLLFLVGGSL